MSSVWYIGPYGERQLSVEDWARLGATVTQSTSWNINNGWSIPEGFFSPKQLEILSKLDGFVTGQPDGPRIKRAAVIPPSVNGEWMYYYEKVKDLVDQLQDLGDIQSLVDTVPQKITDATAILFGSARSSLNEGKIKGGNITIKPAGIGSWAGMWSEWDWDYWIKPQIDRLIVLGGNTVRVIGAPQAVLNPATTPAQITQETYDSHWKQLADYCLQKGLRLYPCLTEEWAFRGWTGAPNNFQAAISVNSIKSTASLLARYRNVIGFDLFQEGSGTANGLTLADILNLYARVREAAPGIPLTTSSSSLGFGSIAGFWQDSTSLSYQAWVADGGADFVDLHIYLENVNIAQIDSLIERTGMPILIGEFGADQSLSAGSQLARYQSARTIHNRPGILGSIVWALADQGTTDSTKLGIWDNSGFIQGSTALSTEVGKRTALVNEFRKFGIAEHTAQTQINQQNILPAYIARAIGQTTGWQAGSNSYLFTDNRGVGVAASASGNFSINPLSRLPAKGSTPYRFDIYVLNSFAGRTITLGVDSYDSNGSYITTSPLVTEVTKANIQTMLRLHGAFTTHANAVTMTFVIRVQSAAANESMIIAANPLPYIGGI